MLSPLRKENPLWKLWRVLYPIGIHFLIFQGAGSLILLFMMYMTGGGQEVYYDNAVLLTGIAGLFTVLPSLYFYRRDHVRRLAGGLLPGLGETRLSTGEGVLLLLLGAGAAHFFNIVVNILQIFISSTEYQESISRITEGKGLLMMIFWMGIIAPVAEELVFRWLVYLRLRDYMKTGAAALISGLLFGVYHGNILQGIYAFILGILFALLLESTGSLLSCILLHCGANIWSLTASELAVCLTDAFWISVFGMAVLLLIVISAVILAYFLRKGKIRSRRCV